MKMRSAFTMFAASYFGWVFIRNGTAGKLIDDFARGGKDITRGLGGASKLA